MIKLYKTILSSGTKLRLLLLGLAIISLASAGFVTTMAQDGDSGGDVDPAEDMRVARISLIKDYVSMQRGDDDSQWFDGTVNTPLQTGDRLYTGDAGRSELQMGSSFFVRLDNRTGLDVVDLSSERSQFRLYSGSVLINLRNQPAQSIEIDTPNAAVTVGDAGEYRIDVINDSRAEVVVLRGSAEVYNGDQILVREGQRMILEAGDKAYYDLTDLPERDDWDNWNQQRDDQLNQEAESLNYIPDNQSIEGAEDLTQYGQWTDVPEYGRAWSPRNVSSDWAPYRDGGWVWRDPYGWTWVSSEPWGWAPYHYGRWAYASNRWYWVPGRYRRYSPALVGFIGYGPTGSVAWVPLAPRDRFNPWWGRRRTTFTEVVYINQGYRNTISYSTRETFGNGRIYHHDALFIRPGERGRAILLPAVIPSRESLVIRSNRGPVVARVVPTYFNRTVIVRNNRAPVVRPFAEKVAIIRTNGGAPVSSVRVTSTGTREVKQITTQTRTTNSTGNNNNGGPRKLERHTMPAQNYTRNTGQSQGTGNGQQPKGSTNNQTQQPKTQTNGQQPSNNNPPTRRVYPTNQTQTNNGQQQGNGKQQTGNGGQPQGNGQKPMGTDQTKRSTTNTTQGTGQQPQNSGTGTQDPKRATNNNTQPQGNNQPKRNTDTNSHPQGNTQHPQNNNQTPAKTNNNPPPARTTTQQQPQKPVKKPDPPKKDDKSSDKKKPPTN